MSVLKTKSPQRRSKYIVPSNLTYGFRTDLRGIYKPMYPLCYCTVRLSMLSGHTNATCLLRTQFNISTLIVL